MMSHVVHIERVFATRAEAEEYMDSLEPTAWPYVWCIEDLQANQWRVTALLEQPSLPAVS